MLPMQDYERISSTVKAILDSEDAETAHSCQFFALMGAAILYAHYDIQCSPIFGAAFIMLDEPSRDVLSYGRFEGGRVISDSDNYHAWLEVGDTV